MYRKLKKAYDDKFNKYNSPEEATASKKKVPPKKNKLDGMTSFHQLSKDVGVQMAASIRLMAARKNPPLRPIRSHSK